MGKQAVIMEAMTELVHQYGYAKVTMDDIAKASGLSRPALYQFFRNKQEIYRAIASSMLEACLRQMDDVFAEDEPPSPDRLFRALKVGLLDHMAEMESTTHGAELMDLKNELSADIIAEFAEGLVERMVSEFARVGEGLPLPPQAMAANLHFWLEGMKTQVKDPAEREALLRSFLTMQFASIADESSSRDLTLHRAIE